MTDSIPPTAKPPRRRRYLLRGLVTLLLGVGALLIVLQVLASRAETAFRAKVQAIRDAGEPFSVAEVCDFGGVPDDANAVIPLRQAATLVPDVDMEIWRKVEDLPFVVPLTDAERAYARLSAGPIEQVEALIREAMTRPSAHWKLKITGRMIDAAYPDLNAQRALAQAIDYSILLATDRGDYAAALDRIPLLFAIERAMQTHPSVVGYLVSSGIESMALARLEDLSARMKIGHAINAVPAEKVRQTIRLLDDDPGEWVALQQAFRGDRAQFIKICQMLAQGELPDGSEPGLQGRVNLFLSRPQLWDGCRVAVDTYAKFAVAMTAANWPACQAMLPDQKKFAGQRNAVLKMLSVTMPSHVRVGRFPYQNQSWRRLARVGLAVHLYVADHSGRWPESLDDLVPKYVAEIPLDTLAAGGAHVRFVPGERPLIYSVGEDGIDGGGADRLVTGGGIIQGVGIQPGKVSGDLLFRLSPQPRPEVEPDDIDDANE